jgi:hypothetical protein
VYLTSLRCCIPVIKWFHFIIDLRFTCFSYAYHLHSNKKVILGYQCGFFLMFQIIIKASHCVVLRIHVDNILKLSRTEKSRSQKLGRIIIIIIITRHLIWQSFHCSLRYCLIDEFGGMTAPKKQWNPKMKRLWWFWILIDRSLYKTVRK